MLKMSPALSAFTVNNGLMVPPLSSSLMPRMIQLARQRCQRIRLKDLGHLKVQEDMLDMQCRILYRGV
jgi:hypothetical protein